ncbi:MAG TPA: adenylate kinase [Ktedonobacterales bacterium]|nr:adenylate kinase [Ktedonobacterales bacterium]
MNILLIGAQGSGKGTQAELLAQKLHLKPLASGDILRDAIAHETPLGKQARPYLERGDLVPDAIVVGLILDAIQRLDDAQGFILDGFPRTIPQAQTLDERLSAHNEPIEAAVYLEVPREQLLDRLSGRYICRLHGHVWNIKTKPPKVPGVCDIDGSELYQRSDDQPEKIAHRLDIFFSETIRLLDYYERQGKLLRVDGTGEIDRVNEAVIVGIEGGAALKGLSAPVAPRTESMQYTAG